MVILLKLDGNSAPTNGKQEYLNLLVKIHDFKAFSAQYGNPSFQEDKIVRLRWQEKVAIDSEPLGLSRSESKTRS